MLEGEVQWRCSQSRADAQGSKKDLVKPVHFFPFSVRLVSVAILSCDYLAVGPVTHCTHSDTCPCF